MGEILGVGVTHYPPLLGKPGKYADLLRAVLKSPLVPDEMKNPENWPEPMQEEYTNEEARSSQHQAQMVEDFRQVQG